MAVDVTTPVFEGPFDLLLHLILPRAGRHVRGVAEQRSSTPTSVEIERMQSIDLDLATEFLLIAATLVELKAAAVAARAGRRSTSTRSWRCGRSATCCSPGWSSARRSRTWPRCSAGFADDADRCYGRAVGPTTRFADLLPDLLDGVGPERIQRAYLRAITPKAVPRIDLFHVAPVRASVADTMKELVVELPRIGRLSFRRLDMGWSEQMEVIVRSSLLELFKQGDGRARAGRALRRHRDRAGRPGTRPGVRGGDGA